MYISFSLSHTQSSTLSHLELTSNGESRNGFYCLVFTSPALSLSHVCSMTVIRFITKDENDEMRLKYDYSAFAEF